MENTISLKKTKNILINLDSSTDRLNFSTQILNKLQIPFNRFSAIKHDIGILGCGLSHYDLLSTIKPNTLILEDDIESTEFFSLNLSVPKEADAIYLGISDHGYIRNQRMGYRGTVLASQYNKNYKRVFNMCSTHAILYLSQKYINAAKDIVFECLQKSIPFDLGLAAIHKDYNILTPNDPMFYQIEQSEFTKFSLKV